jgi:radical SAM protein with 4Fe4S-binding SPASM domain
MDMRLYEKIIDDAHGIPHIDNVTIQGLGEPLLDPLLEDRLRYTYGKLRTLVFTNGSFLTAERFHSLVDAGLSALVVSVNAVSQDQHTRIMGLKDKFDDVVSACEYVIENKPDDFGFQVHATLNGDTFTASDRESFETSWGEYALVRPEGNWAGKNRTLPWDFSASGCCRRAIGMIYVLWDGTVTACCTDPTGRLTFGNLSEQSIREVYNSPEYTKFREDHWEGRPFLYDICRGCKSI